MNDTKQMNNKHICAHGNDGHCCGCAGCGGYRHHARRWIALIVGVLLAFWVGMKLGEIKGFMMASYGMVPMHHERMRDWSDDRMVPPTETVPTAPQQ